MSWLINLSMTLSSAVIFFYLSIIVSGGIIEHYWGWEKEKYGYWGMFILWLLLNIWQWGYLK